MLALIKELADRFIEFVLAMVKGETVEEQLTSALKSCIFLISVLGCAVAALAVSNLNKSLEISDMEVGVAKVKMLFDTEGGGPINGFLRINDMLSTQNNEVKQENILLLKSNAKLTEENHWLRLHLIKILEENDLLRNNNEALLNKYNPLRDPRR